MGKTPADVLVSELLNAADPRKAAVLQRFFKTGPGEYAEGDIFLGVMVPQTRALVKKYWRDISIPQVETLLRSKYHEGRLAALFILVAKFEKGDECSKKEIFDVYLGNTGHINNWDLVDLTAPRIVGAYLDGRDKKILFKLAHSEIVWERRIAMLATSYDIYKGNPNVALEIAGILVNDKHDLIQKAVGWMLREVGKRCGQKDEEQFLEKHYKTMPRTALRYAIERFDSDKRRYYLAK